MSIKKGNQQMNVFTRSNLAMLVLAATATMAVAQEQQPGLYRTASGVDLLPGLLTTVFHDDNITRAANQQDIVSSWVLSVAPSLKASIIDGANVYSMTGAVKAANYFDSSDDNYLDGYVEAEARLSPSSAHNFKLNANSSWLHEDRGTGVSEGRGTVQGDVTKFNTDSLKAEYEYGRPGSTGKLRANARYFDRKYENFRDFTQYRDYKLAEVGAGFVYQTAGAFRLVAETTTADIQYKVVDLSGSRDNQDTYFKLGTEWELTAATTGILKAGYQNKDFDIGLRDDFDGVSWEAIMQWQPLSYSGFDFATGRRAKDVEALNSSADFIKESTVSVGWNHQWSSFIDTKLSYQYQTDDYHRRVGSTAVAREDKIRMLIAEVNYKPLRWLTLTGYANVEDRTSSAGVIEYDRNVFGLTFKMTL